MRGGGLQITKKSLPPDQFSQGLVGLPTDAHSNSYAANLSFSYKLAPNIKDQEIEYHVRGKTTPLWISNSVRRCD
jgi:hypothetical protein